jgi:methenyltetrahydrofolate cyclohydrolase
MQVKLQPLPANPKMSDRSVNEFLDELASSAPAPGGGAVAALAGALAAALVSMVAHLTQGKRDYEAVQGPVSQLLEQSERLRGRLAALMGDDYDAFMRLSYAMKLPRGSDDEKAARASALQAALQDAAAVPLQIAEACADTLQLCRPIAEVGNKNAVSDAGVAVLMAEAGLRSAALNVLINLALIKDAAFVASQRARLDGLLAGSGELADEVYQYVVSRL